MGKLDRLSTVGDTETTGMGFIGALRGSAPDDVTIDTVVPFGEIRRNCTVKTSQMGTRISDASGYEVYDTNAKALGSRTHFLTGFRDGCARQFSGSVVMLGDVGTHEMFRYTNVGLKRPYSTTDEAYELIKASFCRVGRGEPCGKRIDRLAKTTTFLTVYETLATRSRWANTLVHRGEIVAEDVHGG